MLENPNYKLYYERSLITDYTIHNNCLDVVLLDKNVKEAHLRNAEISNSHNLHSTITEQLDKCTDLQDEQTEYNNWKRPM
jgi:hypothetical protein